METKYKTHLILKVMLLSFVLTRPFSVNLIVAETERPDPKQSLIQSKRMVNYGILYVTEAPYSADSSGRQDSTKAIQQAVINARDSRMIVFFPVGEYLVSDTITASQIAQPNVDNLLLGRRDDYPCILWGSTQGGRTKIVLKNNSPGFGDWQNPKPVIRTETFQGNPNISFNQMIISLDVDLGHGNPGAIGIDHQGAQGCVTEDVGVVAEGAFAGFRGTSGSGGSASHLRVRGGQYGLYLSALRPPVYLGGSQPAPVISCVTLIGQTEKSIFSGTRGPLTLVGASIEGPGIHLEGSYRPWNGALNIVDSVIRYRGEGPVITGNRPVYLNNVFFKDASEIAHLDNVPMLEGVRDGWMHVVEYAVGPSPTYPIWINGVKQIKPLATLEPNSAPPNDLHQAHEWAEALPSWQDSEVVNVKNAPYSAAGDGKTDDTDAIQRALDENRDVFLPKGIYCISRPLRLRSDNRLFGLGVHSKIDPMPEASAFADPMKPTPMLTTPNDAGATCIAAFFQLSCRIPGAYAIHWQAGRKSIVRNVRTKARPWPRGAALTNHPMILIDGKGGGRWYNALMHNKFPQGPDHRHILVRGTREPLAFYMLNPEHSSANHMVEFDGVRNVNVYSLKSETLGAGGPRAITPVLVRGSSGFRFFGHAGNASPPEGKPLYRIEKCTDFLFANFSYQIRGGDADASTWFMVEEIQPDGNIVQTPGVECFALYKQE